MMMMMMMMTTDDDDDEEEADKLLRQNHVVKHMESRMQFQLSNPSVHAGALKEFVAPDISK